MWINLLRLTDKALREYEGARGQLNEWLSGRHDDAPRLSPFYRGIDRLENCVVTTHRAVLYAQALHARGWGKGSPRVTSRQQNRLRHARNGVEHGDEWLVEGRKIKEGQAHMLVPLDRRMQIGREQLTYRELASCIEKLYATVLKIRKVPPAKR